jgi:hypothetical protein
VQRVFVLKDEKRVFRQHCCDTLTEAVNFRCAEHVKPHDCSHQFFYHSPAWDKYGIMIHAESEMIVMSHCPFCGAAFPPSRREAWFASLSGRGIDIFRQTIPAQFLSAAWYENHAEV